MQEFNDKEILGLLRSDKGKRDAYTLIVKTYEKRVYWHVRRLLNDHEDTNDVVQNVFLKVWENLDKYRGDAQIYTWIYRIASNEALNFLKSRNRKASLSLDDYPDHLATKSDSSPSASGEEIQFKLQRAIDLLPDKQKLVFNLKYFEEMHYDEMSEITGTSVGALKASYHHAVKKIEDLINPD